MQPALKSDGWDSEPFEVTERDGKLFGRGTSDDKGPVIAWIHALEAFKATKHEIPVNVKVFSVKHILLYSLQYISQLVTFANVTFTASVHI